MANVWGTNTQCGQNDTQCGQNETQCGQNDTQCGQNEVFLTLKLEVHVVTSVF